MTLNFSSHYSDFNLGACLCLAKIKSATAESYLNSCFCCVNFTSVEGSLQVENADEITSVVTEQDVVRDLGCDNQEIKIGKK